MGYFAKETYKLFLWYYFGYSSCEIKDDLTQFLGETESIFSLWGKTSNEWIRDLNDCYVGASL